MEKQLAQGDGLRDGWGRAQFDLWFLEGNNIMHVVKNDPVDRKSDIVEKKEKCQSDSLSR